MALKEKGLHYGGDRYRVFYTVSQAAKKIGMAKSGLFGRVERNTVEYILLTDWNRQDTVDRAMIEERVIICEREKLLAKKENRDIEVCQQQEILITLKPSLHRVHVPISYEYGLGEVFQEYRESAQVSEFDVKYQNISVDPNLMAQGDTAEIYIHGDYSLHVIPYSVLYQQSQNKKLFDVTDKFDIYVILQTSGTYTFQFSLEQWNPIKKQVLSNKNFDALQKFLIH